MYVQEVREHYKSNILSCSKIEYGLLYPDNGVQELWYKQSNGAYSYRLLLKTPNLLIIYVCTADTISESFCDRATLAGGGLYKHAAMTIKMIVMILQAVPECKEEKSPCCSHVQQQIRVFQPFIKFNILNYTVGI